MISTLIVPVNQAAADEPANLVKLTPFSISFAKEDFDKFARVHGIMWLMEGESADLRVRLHNDDDKQHEIQFHIMNIGSTPAMEEVVSMSITPETIVVEPHSSGQTVLHLNASNFVPETQQGTVGIVAKSTTFGATGEFFYLLVGNNVSESDTFFFDTPLRESAPGSITTYVNNEADFEYFENLLGFRVALPSYLPSNYTMRDVDLISSDVRILYSPVEVTTETGFYEFFKDGGIFVIYSKDPPDFNAYILSSSSYGSQEVMVNDFIGVAWDQREQVTVGGNHFKSESGIVLFKDNFMIELRGGVPLEELLKVAASLQYQDQELDVFKIVNTTRLISIDKQKEFCCISLAVSLDGSKIAYSTTSYINASTIEHTKLLFYDVHDKTSTELGRFNSTYIQDLSFSPDGSKLLFLTQNYDGDQNPFNFCMISIANERKFQCTEFTHITSADWMPDGSLVVAKNIGNETVGNILQITMQEKNGTEKLLYSENYYDSLMLHVRASPDGKKIAFHAERPLSGNKIYVLELESGQLDKVVENGVQPRWSPDSKFLIYNETPRRAPPNVYEEFLKNNPVGIIKMVDIQSKEITTLVRPADRIGIYDLTVFPDGSKLIYASYENIYDEGSLVPRTQMSSGIYTADLSQAIPEFPISLMVIMAIALTGMLIALRAKSNGIVDPKHE